MARPHIRLTIKIKNIATANKIKQWLESKLSLISLNKLNKCIADGQVNIIEKNDTNTITEPTLIFFANVSTNLEVTKLFNFLKEKISDFDLISIKIETWSCSHDEAQPKPCKPKIIYNKKW